MATRTAVLALVTWAAREFMRGTAVRARGGRRGKPVPRPVMETWENEGGNLAPRDARTLQQQLG